MKSFILGLVITTLLIPATAPAETNLEISGQVRARGELNGRGLITDDNDHWEHFGLLRTRLNIHATVENNAHALIQFQDSRLLGDTTFLGQPGSGGLADGKNVDIHQAYARVDRMFTDGLGMQAGRFEVNLGNQRVFGAVGWSNVGRTWDGLSTWYRHEEFDITGFWLKKLELNDPDRDRDFDVFGTNLAVDKLGLEVFGFHERDRTPAPGTDANQLERTDLGMYWHRSKGRYDVRVNAVYQLGTWRTTELGPLDMTANELDIGAYLGSIEFSYSFPGRYNGLISIGAELQSGDGDSTDTDFNAYDNLYYTGHKFNGYMDLFTPATRSGKPWEYSGLVDIMVRAQADPFEEWTVKGDVHFFSTPEEYKDPTEPLTDRTTRGLGTEFDLVVTTRQVTGANIEFGGSVFFPRKEFAGRPDPSTAYWFYTMTTVTF